MVAIPQAVKAKEKPLVKTPIPGTEWLRVRTTQGNVFYSHKVKKESIWTVPDEIKDAVAALEKTEKDREDRKLKEKILKAEDAAQRAERERLSEIERVKNEVQQDLVKRKAEEPLPVDEVITKKARVDDDVDEGGEDEESEEEDWQREAAAQLAEEAEQERQRVEEEARLAKEEEEEAEAKRAKESAQLNMPAKVDLSVEEAKALFKASISLSFP